LKKKLGFVSGPDFSHAANLDHRWTALQVEEKLGFVSGHDFSRAAKDGQHDGL
jgi:hypothetical protein